MVLTALLISELMVLLRLITAELSDCMEALRLITSEATVEPSLCTCELRELSAPLISELMEALRPCMSEATCDSAEAISLFMACVFTDTMPEVAAAWPVKV